MPARGNPPLTSLQRTLFIEHLARSANVTGAAHVAGFNRRTAYDYRYADPEFAAEWDDALEASIDDLEGIQGQRSC
jgi:hypothetical protein